MIYADRCFFPHMANESMMRKKACIYLDSGTMVFFFFWLLVGFEISSNESDADPNGSTL